MSTSRRATRLFGCATMASLKLRHDHATSTVTSPSSRSASSSTSRTAGVDLVAVVLDDEGPHRDRAFASATSAAAPDASRPASAPPQNRSSSVTSTARGGSVEGALALDEHEALERAEELVGAAPPWRATIAA